MNSKNAETISYLKANAHSLDLSESFGESLKSTIGLDNYQLTAFDSYKRLVIISVLDNIGYVNQRSIL